MWQIKKLNAFFKGGSISIMKNYTNNFTGNILKFSLVIAVVFILSCGKEGTTQQAKSDKWYVNLGFKDVCVPIKKDTQLLSQRLRFGEFKEAEILCNKILRTFNKFDFKSPDIPEDFFEFKQGFEKRIANLLTLCEEKKREDVEVKLKAFKHSCKYCHRVFRSELAADGFEKDFGVAVDGLYKDKQTD